MEKEKKIEEPKFEQKFEYDERRKILTSTVSKSQEGVKGEYQDTFDEKGIRNLYKGLMAEKKQGQDALNNVDKLISTLEDRRDALEKQVPKLTDAQKQLIEDMKVLQRVQPLEDVKTQLAQKKEALKHVQKELKEKNRVINEVVQRVKFKLKE